jgi:hypothetical protein
MVREFNVYTKENQLLERYISENYASKADFARYQGIKPQRVTEMLKAGYIVVDGVVYSKRFELYGVSGGG